jgi:hypothetical protein
VLGRSSIGGGWAMEARICSGFAIELRPQSVTHVQKNLLET